MIMAESIPSDRIDSFAHIIKEADNFRASGLSILFWTITASGMFCQLVHLEITENTINISDVMSRWQND